MYFVIFNFDNHLKEDNIKSTKPHKLFARKNIDVTCDDVLILITFSVFTISLQILRCRRLPFWRRLPVRRRCPRLLQDRWRTRLSRGRSGLSGWRPPRGQRLAARTQPKTTRLSCRSKSLIWLSWFSNNQLPSEASGGLRYLKWQSRRVLSIGEPMLRAFCQGI